MKIPINDFNLKELLETLKAFPDGKVEVEDNKAYWNTTNKTPQIQVQQIEQPVYQQQQVRQRRPDTFTKMRDSLFSAFG